MYNLTANSNVKALAFLWSLEDMRTNIKVRVNGKLVGGLLEISDLHVQDIGATSTATYCTGYIADRYCLDGVNAPDGANMMEGPQNHSTKCMLLEQCRTSGYSVLQKKRLNRSGVRVPGYGAIYNLTDQSTKAVIAYLETIPDSTKDLFWNHSCSIDSNGIATYLDSAGKEVVTGSFNPAGTKANTTGSSGAAHVATLSISSIFFVCIALLM
jgi:hypothetical protein